MPLMILVADDDEGIRLFVKEYLEVCGYTVITAENGRNTLQLLQVYHPHLLITDIMMPEMDGYELVQELRQFPQYRLLPVIFLTEKSSIEERIKGYNLGCDFYLPKPFDIHELGAMVKNLLERSQILQTEWRVNLTTDNTQPDKYDLAKFNLEINRDFLNQLTPREKEVIELISRGLSNIEIGEKMHLSPRTVEKYVSSLFRKTETNNRTELVRFALENNLVV
jgi:DNA-binding NarL/FixJ family response regulator